MPFLKHFQGLQRLISRLDKRLLNDQRSVRNLLLCQSSCFRVHTADKISLDDSSTTTDNKTSTFNMADAMGESKKNWAQLRELVKKSYRQVSELPINVPFSINFVPLNDAQGNEIGVRLYFLGALDNSLENTLVYSDVLNNPNSTTTSMENSPAPVGTSAEEEETMQLDATDSSKSERNAAKTGLAQLQWKPLLDSSDKEPIKTEVELSLQEKLQLERKRMMAAGLTSYEFHSGKRRFLFTIAGNLHYLDDEGQPPYAPIAVKSQLKGAKINPSICPSNPDLVAFVCDNNLYVTNLISGEEIALTDLAKQFPGRQLTAGLPSYVVQEEFSRYNGFWWRPTTMPETDDSQLDYQILFELVDETNVDQFKISTWDGGVEDYRFPRPGRLNANSDLKLGSFKLNTQTNQIHSGQMDSLNGLDSLSQLFSKFEYLVRAQYVTFDTILVQQLDRDQRNLVLTLFSLKGHFPPQVLSVENISPHWAHVSDLIHFINFDKSKSLRIGDELEYLWTSQRSGFRHLYKLRSTIVNVGETSQTTNSNLGDLLHSKMLDTVQLTFGNWEVSDKDSWLDRVNHLLYFVARKESPLETQLYVINYDRPEDGDIIKLTTSGYSHGGIAFNEQRTVFTTIQSSISVPPLGYVYRKSVSDSKQLQFNRIAKLVDNEERNLDHLNRNFADEHLPTFAKPELFSCQLKESGEIVYGLIFKPDFMQAGVKYPVLLEVYGGPAVQMVSNSYRSVRLLRRHLLASQGYVVCVFDCRGSYHRGVQFEGHLRDRLGQVEVSDQVEVLQWLAATTNYIDMNRVSVHGWSYGGYLSLLCYAQRPEIFRMCVAGAPVTNWKLYDTGYTERYLGVPPEKDEQYQAGSVLSQVNNMPSEENRLMIIHGMMDENVHFQHTVELIQELIKAGKPYQLQVFPFERHCLRNQAVREHYLTALLWFFNQHL